MHFQKQNHVNTNIEQNNSGFSGASHTHSPQLKADIFVQPFYSTCRSCPYQQRQHRGGDRNKAGRIRKNRQQIRPCVIQHVYLSVHWKLHLSDFRLQIWFCTWKCFTCLIWFHYLTAMSSGITGCLNTVLPMGPLSWIRWLNWSFRKPWRHETIILLEFGFSSQQKKNSAWRPVHSDLSTYSI